ncbi:MAG: hypothetical protein HGB02_02005 [Chlorobiaceae bacterium]|nr:hypothetical protein [Chlorobiaceae bacterium]
MANISLYVSGQTELNDVTEFLQKRLIGEGETPIAFFDGVFYESHQERVGNIVFQDYLVYTDKAIYLWARGTSKDFLDRFSLGAVSVNSRNKDSAFATMNLKIKREGKEPVYVIFDMVEIREAATIVKLHTVIESTVEDYLGLDFRQEIPQEIANMIVRSAHSICPPRTVSIALEAPRMPMPDDGIGYGQDLLEQYKASIGYSHEQEQQQPGAPPRQRTSAPTPEMPRGLEGILPTDPAAIKRIAGQLKGMVGDAPLKFRDQLMKDLQHVPNDVATVLTAVNELLTNIAGNPQAERFVMNAIKTAVENDGLIGSVGKIIKLTGIGSPKKPSRPAQAPAREDRPSRPQRSSSRMEDAGDDSTIRRRKISVRDDDDHPGAFDPFRDEEPPTARDERPASAARRPVTEDEDYDAAPRKKKLSIRVDGDADNEIARKMMGYDDADAEPAQPRGEAEDDPSPRRKKLSIRTEGDDADDITHKLMSYDESEREQAPPAAAVAQPRGEAEDEPAPRRKKLSVRADGDGGNEIARKLMSFDEVAGEELQADIRPEPVAITEPEAAAPIRKEIQVKADEARDSFKISEDDELAARGGGESGGSYLTLESNLPLQAPAGIQPVSGEKDDNAGRASDTNSVSVKPTP